LDHSMVSALATGRSACGYEGEVPLRLAVMQLDLLSYAAWSSSLSL
jgi:hypothetical protein